MPGWLGSTWAVPKKCCSNWMRRLTVFERAVGLLPDHLPALLNLAHLLIELQRPTDALPHLDRVLVLNPGHALAFRLRGDALMALGRCADALEKL